VFKNKLSILMGHEEEVAKLVLSNAHAKAFAVDLVARVSSENPGLTDTFYYLSACGLYTTAEGQQ
jgi:hypothetical protein